MTTQLALYNGALLHLGERRLSSLSDETEARRSLDDVWDGGAYRQFLLEQGLWNFAIRTVELTYSPSITPSFGYRYGFDLPSDWVRTAGISGDEYFRNPLEYAPEQQYIFSDYETIYLRYVSNDTEYGYDMTAWPSSFTEWVKAHLAARIAKRVTGSAAETERMLKIEGRLLIEARSKDAMNDAISYPPSGSWARSRYGNGGDRGNRGQLIG